MKAIAKVSGMIAILIVLIWTCGHFYWRVKIVRLIEKLEFDAANVALLKEKAPIVSESRWNLDSAGCRTLPYLLERLSPEKSSDFLNSSLSLIFYETGKCRCGRASRKEGFLTLDLEEYAIGSRDSATERQRKCKHVKEFWAESLKRHQWWRWWSDSCLPD